MKRLLYFLILISLSAAPAAASFMKGGTVASAPVFNGLPTVASSPSGIFSTYLLVSSYSGPLFRLARVSDSAVMDIYPNTDGSPNLSAVSTWLGGAAYAKCTIIYDQSGGGNDAVGLKAFSLTNAVNGIYTVTYDPTVPSSSTHFVIPSGHSGVGNSVTSLDIVDYQSTNTAAATLLGSTYGAAGSLSLKPGKTFQASLTVKVGIITNQTAHAYSRSQPQLTIASSGSSNVISYQDGHTDTFAANTADSWSGGHLGYADASNFLAGEFMAHIDYPTALNPSDVATLKTYLDAKFKTSLTSNAQIVIPGNSIVEGTGATLLQNWVRQAEPLLTRPVYISNQGIFGQLAATEYGDRATYYAQYRSDLAKNIMEAPEATNDIDGLSTGNIVGAGTTLYNNYIVPFVQQAQTAGFDVIVPTILPRNFTGSGSNPAQKETERLAYNNLVVSNATTYGYTVVDFASIPQLSNPSNTTYYVDGIHPTSLGYSYMATLFASVANPRLAANDNPSPNLFAANDNHRPILLMAAK